MSLLDLVFVQKKRTDEVVQVMVEIYGKDKVVANTKEMVALSIWFCTFHSTKIASIRFVSHGAGRNYENGKVQREGLFFIGYEMINSKVLTPNYSEYPEKSYIYHSLATLRPFFDRKAMVYIDACHAGEDTDLLKALSRVLGVPVVGWNGDIEFSSYPNVKTKEYAPGNMMVCVGNLCLYDSTPTRR